MLNPFSPDLDSDDDFVDTSQPTKPTPKRKRSHRRNTQALLMALSGIVAVIALALALSEATLHVLPILKFSRSKSHAFNLLTKLII